MLRVLPIHIPRFTGPRQTCFAFSGVNSMDHVTDNFIQSDTFVLFSLPLSLPFLRLPRRVEVSIHENCNDLICCKVGSKTCNIALHLNKSHVFVALLTVASLKVFKFTQYVLSCVNICLE